MGTLYVVGTPIGNLEDMSPRAVRILSDVSLIAAEDTRHTRRLLTHFAISTPLMSYHEHNRRKRRDQLLQALSLGDVALVSDAGTPAISDPGADLVAAALEAGHRVSPIPGPSALTAAISVSGLIDGSFMGLGFLPRTRGERRAVVGRAAASGLPLVIFEAANRLPKTLAELASALGDRRATLTREISKLHEDVRSGTLASLQDWAATAEPRGEVVLVVGAATGETKGQTEDAQRVLALLLNAGLSASQAAREAAAVTGLPRSELYRLALNQEKGESVRLEGEFSLSDENALQESLGDEKRPKRGET